MSSDLLVRGTGTPGPSRRRWLGPVLAGLLLAAVGALAVRAPDSGIAFDPDSTGPTGLRAVVDTLHELDVEVVVSDDLEVAAGADTVLVPPLGWTDEQVVGLARGGPRVLAQVPPSTESTPAPLGLGGFGLVDLAADCDLLADVDELRTAQWQGWTTAADVDPVEECLVRDGIAWLVRVPVVPGELLAVGTLAPLTNERFVDSDAALAAVRLLAPTGHESVVVLTTPPGTPPPTLFDLVDRRWFDAAWLTLALLAVLALASGRRLGHPVDEELPVRVPSGELARAVGDLRHRAGHHERAAAVLRARTLAAARTRLGLPPDADAEAVAEDLRRRGAGADADALTTPLPTGPEGLVRAARALATLRTRLHDLDRDEHRP